MTRLELVGFISTAFKQVGSARSSQRQQ